MKVNGNLTLPTGGLGQIENMVIEKLSSTPAFSVSEAGRMIYNTSDSKFYFNNGSAWVSGATGGDATALQNEVDALELALGTTLFNGDGTFNAATANAYANVSGATDLEDVLSQLDAAVSGADAVSELTDVTLTVAENGDFLMFDGAAWVDKTSAQVVTQLGLDIGTNVQAWDADLDAFAALAGTGIVVKTGPGSFAERTITESSTNALTVTNGSGVASDIDIAIEAGLDSIAGLTVGSGDIIYATAADTFAAAQPGATSGVQAHNANLDDLSALIEVTADDFIYGTGAGTFGYSTITTLGRALVDDVTDADMRTTLGLVDGGSGDIWVKKAGDTMTGLLILSGDPTAPNHATNKSYVDALVAGGASWKNPVVDSDLVDVIAANVADPETDYALSVGDNVTFIVTASMTATLGVGTDVVAVAGDIINLSITSAGNGDYHLVETPLTTGDRFIIAAEHGTIGTALAALVVDGFALANGDLVEHVSGDGSSAAHWSVPDGRSGNAGGGVEIAQGVTVLNSDPDSVHYGHTYLYDQVSNAWVEISGPGATGAGDGLVYVGNVLNINMGAGIAQLPSDEVGIDLYSATGGALILTTDGATDSTATGAKLHLQLAANLTQDATGLFVTAGGITETELATSIAGDGLVGGAGTALAINLQTGGGLAITTDELHIAVASVSNAMLTNDTINFTYDSLGGSVALGGTFDIAGGSGITTQLAAGGVIISGNDATTAAKGVASFDPAHFTVTTGAVSLAASLADLTNVTADSTTLGDVLVNDGADYVNRQIHYVEASASATTHVITHNLGQKYCNVTIVDTVTDEVIIPQTIKFDTTLQLTVTVNVATAITVIATGV